MPTNYTRTSAEKVFSSNEEIERLPTGSLPVPNASNTPL
jgi:hypothetical protein